MNLKTKGELNVTVFNLLGAMKKWQLFTNNALSLDLIHGQFFPCFFVEGGGSMAKLVNQT